MDLVDYSEARFREIVDEYKTWLASQGLDIPDLQCIPLSALEGDNVVDPSPRTPWYKGPSLLNFLETVEIDLDINMHDFRFPVQYVLRPDADFRGYSGKIASGIVRRQPDARWLRRESDIAQLAGIQSRLLDALWPLLAPGGAMLYCTCSVFRAEGQAQLQAFLSRNSEARALPAPGHLLPGIDAKPQALAHNGTGDHDGFFYALLRKNS